MNKLGIFGGSFDPVHLGHLQLALQAKEELNLSKVIFVPTKYQPFKLGKKVTSEEHRVNMLKGAIRGEKELEISFAELEKDEISYTINTLKRIKTSYDKNTEIFFILGTDSFINLESWYMSKELLQQYSFAVGSRPGYREDELNRCIDHVREVYNTNVVLLHNKKLPISSTEVKATVKSGQSIKTLVPLAVERYINENGLYQ